VKRTLLVACVLGVLTTFISSSAWAAPPAQPDPLGEAGKMLTLVVAYVQSVEVHNVEVAVDVMLTDAAAYVRQVEADEAAERARAYAARPPAAASPSSSSLRVPAGGGGGGSCYDGPIPAYIVTRESGGNPTAMNPSGAYGCFQIMPYVWSANCSDLGRDVAGQIACAGRISNGGSNLQPWALTR
jgi:hypothetical protein